MKILIPLLIAVGGALAWALWPANPEAPAPKQPKPDQPIAKAPAPDEAADPAEADPTEADPAADPAQAAEATVRDPRSATAQPVAKGDPVPAARPNLDAPPPPPPTSAELAEQAAKANQPTIPELRAGEYGPPPGGYRTFTPDPKRRSTMNQVGRAAFLKDIQAYRSTLPATGQLPQMLKAADVLSDDVLHDLRLGPNDMIIELGDAPVYMREGYDRLTQRLDEPAQHIVGLTIRKPDGRQFRDYVEVVYPEQ